MDYASLKAELVNDPEAIGYASMSAAQCASSLGNPIYTGWQDVPTATVKAYLIGNNLWRSLQASTVPQAEQMVDTISSFSAIQLSNPTYLAWTQAALNQLVASNILTSAQQQAILSFGQIKVSRAQQIGWNVPPTEADVLAARSN